MLEKVKQAIAAKFAPAIDFKAPYAKVMLDMAAKEVIETIKHLTIEAMAFEGVEIEIRQKVIKQLIK